MGFMKLLGWNVSIRGRDIPCTAWIIMSVGVLIVCMGVAASLVYRGTVAMKMAPLHRTADAASEYARDPLVLP